MKDRKLDLLPCGSGNFRPMQNDGNRFSSFECVAWDCEWKKLPALRHEFFRFISKHSAANLRIDLVVYFSAILRAAGFELGYQSLPVVIYIRHVCTGRIA